VILSQNHKGMNEEIEAPTKKSNLRGKVHESGEGGWAIGVLKSFKVGSSPDPIVQNT